MTEWRHWIIKDARREHAQRATYYAWVARGRRQDEYPGIRRHLRLAEYDGFVDAERL